MALRTNRKLTETVPVTPGSRTFRAETMAALARNDAKRSLSEGLSGSKPEIRRAPPKTIWQNR
jgi:hypothetical protein